MATSPERLPSYIAPGVTKFTELTDVPASYTGQAGKAVKVKATEDGLMFETISVGDPDLLLTYILNGTAVFIYTEEWNFWSICFPNDYTDLAIQTYASIAGSGGARPTYGRRVDPDNYYHQYIEEAAATADHLLRKTVNGINITLATEAIDIYGGRIRSLKLSCQGSTIKAYRANLTTPKLTATDTSFTSGKFGIGQSLGTANYLLTAEAYLLAKKVPAGSPNPQPIAAFEVPIIGRGTSDDPFRAKVPEEIVDLGGERGKANLLAVTHSALIPTGPDGRPLHKTAILRVFESPERPPECKPIKDCLDAIEVMVKGRPLTRENSKDLALQMDKKLKEKDILEF